jgi:hypothetical protein
MIWTRRRTLVLAVRKNDCELPVTRVRLTNIAHETELTGHWNSSGP